MLNEQPQDPAQEAYEKALAQAWEVRVEAWRQASLDYEDAHRQAWRTLTSTLNQTRNAYDAAVTRASKVRAVFRAQESQTRKEAQAQENTARKETP